MLILRTGLVLVVLGFATGTPALAQAPKSNVEDRIRRVETGLRAPFRLADAADVTFDLEARMKALGVPVVRGSTGHRGGHALREILTSAVDNDIVMTPDGPRGPHGSNHRFLLSGNYNTDPLADEAGGQITENVTEQIGCHNTVITLWDSNQLHTHVVNDPIVEIDLRIFLCYLSANSQK